jgi:hypothetical protein
VTFHNDDSSFSVLRIKARGHREVVTVVGTLPEVRAGEWLDAQGHWIVSKEYGQQFQAETLRTMPPTTVEGIEKYPAVKALMAKENLKGSGAVFSYYVSRLAAICKKHGKQMIVWEGAPLGAPKDIAIWMPWRGAANDIMQAGYRVIDGMSATQYRKGEPLLLGRNSLLWQYPEEGMGQLVER